MVIDQLVKEGITDVDQETAEAAEAKVIAAMQDGGRTAVAFTWRGDNFEVLLRTERQYASHEHYSYLRVLDAGTRREVPDIIWRRVMMALTAE